MNLRLSIDSLNTEANFRRLAKLLGEKWPEQKKNLQEQAAKPLFFQYKRNAPVRTGTLKGAIELLRFKRSSALFVGPKLNEKVRSKRPKKRNKRFIGGSENFGFKLIKQDAYYAAIVESGVKKGPRKFPGRFYAKRAVNATRALVTRRLLEGSARLLESLGKQAVR